MVLAILESSLTMSAYAIEFMLENWSELKNPCARPRITMAVIEVAEVTPANIQIVAPIISVLTIRIFR